MKKTTMLRNMINSNQLEFIMEAHNGLSGKIVEETGFKGIWASGLSISASLGVRDNNEASWTQVTDVLEYMSDATTIPILMDGDTGFGNFNNARRLVNKLEKIGVAGVCIEDKKFPKANSFLKNSSDSLAPIDEFCGKITAMKDAQTDEDFVVVARLESFIAGVGLEDALKRAEAYVKAGADALLVHSKRADCKEIDQFFREFGTKTPIILVPTKYYATPTSHFKELGVSTVIWANHNVRASISAMQNVSKQIFAEQTLTSVEDKIATVQEIFRIQGNDELERAEKLYLPRGAEDTSSIILAAARGNHLDELTQNKPKTMIKVKGKSILETQIATLQSHEIKNITVVRGYKKEAINIPQVNYVDNDEFENTSEVYSLALAQNALRGQTIISYGDLIFKKHILFDLLNSDKDMAIVVDKDYKCSNYNEFVFSSSKENGVLDEVICANKIAPIADEDDTHHLCGSALGITFVKGKAIETLKELLNEALQSNNKKMNMDTLLNAMLGKGVEVEVVTVSSQDWIDVNNMVDLERASELG
ncbi:MAG: phosphoenolpyruvate mutase [Oscillospiraceae bacterium]